MVRCAPSLRVPTSMTVVTGYWLSNWNSHPTRTRIVVDSLMKAVDVSSITGSRRTRALQLEPPSPLAERRTPPSQDGVWKHCCQRFIADHAHFLVRCWCLRRQTGHFTGFQCIFYTLIVTYAAAAVRRHGCGVVT